jgi:hypothetical protein
MSLLDNVCSLTRNAPLIADDDVGVGRDAKKSRSDGAGVGARMAAEASRQRTSEDASIVRHAGTRYGSPQGRPRGRSLSAVRGSVMLDLARVGLGAVPVCSGFVPCLSLGMVENILFMMSYVCAACAPHACPD